MQKILVLRGGALGDFIVTLPALALLRERWPAAHIELVGNRTAAGLGLRAGLLDAAHSQQDGRWAGLFRPPGEPLPDSLATWLASFDLVVSYWPDPDGLLATRLPCHTRQQFIAGGSTPTGEPAAAYFCRPLTALGLTPNKVHFLFGRELFPPGETSTPRPLVAVHPGSGSARKNWPAENWQQLFACLPGPILVVVGEVERDLWLPRLAREPAGRFQICDQLALPVLAARLCACRHFVGHDSGISHLAAACGLSCTLLFGPTDPSIWAPPAPDIRIVQRGADLAAITVDEVAAAVAPRLATRE